MKNLGLGERIGRLDSWARKHDLHKLNETPFANRKPNGSAHTKNESYGAPSRSYRTDGVERASARVNLGSGASICCFRELRSKDWWDRSIGVSVARERLAQVVFTLSESIGEKASGFVEIDVTNEELASSANITPYTASRMISNERWRDSQEEGQTSCPFPREIVSPLRRALNPEPTPWFTGFLIQQTWHNNCAKSCLRM
jgi:hypothetical protein